MKELIAIESKPALINVNFDTLEEHLAAELKKYDVVVTQDTVKDAKALATKLNATKKDISTMRKEVVSQVSEPIKAFDDRMKGLEGMCTQGRQKILDQVKKFEDETRANAMKVVVQQLEDLWDEQDVEPGFRSAKVDDLATLTALTPKGSITASTYRKIQDRVKENKALQDQTNIRLLKLENESYKAGLAAPLNRGHVETFLFDDDESYRGKLDALFKSELQREEVAQETMRKKIQAEQVRTQQEPAREASAPEVEATEKVRSLHHAEAKPEQSKPGADGKIDITVTCSFKIRIHPGVADSAVEEELRRVLEKKAGITSLETVTVNRVGKAA